MRSYRIKSGFTLIEILIVISIILLLTGMIIKAGPGILKNSKKQQTESTMAILTSALAEYKNYGYQYLNTKFSKFIFPLDCSGLGISGSISIQRCLKTATTINPISPTPKIEILPGHGTPNHKTEYSGCEIMYYFLTKVSTSHKILEKIDPSLITNKDFDGKPMFLTIDNGVTYCPLFRVVDSWGTPLEYDYYKNEDKYNGTTAEFDFMVDSMRNFPLIRSAGPDKEFNTADDITSR